MNRVNLRIKESNVRAQQNMKTKSLNAREISLARRDIL
jgi:ribosomal protein L29